MADPKSDILSFEGVNPKECEGFVSAIRRRALDQGKHRDNEWMAVFASSCFEGDAFYWYEELEEDVQNDWSRLRPALVARFGRGGISPTSVPSVSTTSVLSLSTTVPTPAAAPPIAGALSSVMQVKTGRLKAPDHDGRPRGHIARSVHAEHFTLMATAQKTFECPICVEKCAEGDLARLEGCEHQFCRECLKGHIESCLEERKFPVPCPLCMTDEKREDKYCGGVTLDTMENLEISQDKFDIWLDFEIAKYSILLDCPKCRQSVLVVKDDHASDSILICPVPKCGHMWCKTCYQPVEDEIEEDHSCNGSKELVKFMKAQGWKSCPGCQTVTARTYGCNHMVCGVPGCNTHFCYVDGDFICRAQNNGVAKEAVDAHYRACKLFDVPRK